VPQPEEPPANKFDLNSPRRAAPRSGVPFGGGETGLFFLPFSPRCFPLRSWGINRRDEVLPAPLPVLERASPAPSKGRAGGERGRFAHCRALPGRTGCGGEVRLGAGQARDPEPGLPRSPSGPAGRECRNGGYVGFDFPPAAPSPAERRYLQRVPKLNTIV